MKNTYLAVLAVWAFLGGHQLEAGQSIDVDPKHGIKLAQVQDRMKRIGACSFDPNGPSYSEVVGMDPAADWLLGPAIDDFLPPGSSACEVYFPLMLHLLDDSAARVTEDLFVREGVIFEGPISKDHVVSASVTYEFLDAARKDAPGFSEFRLAQKRIELGLPIPKGSVHPQP